MTLDRLITAQEARTRLGVSPQTLGRWVDAGFVPRPLRFGRTVRYRQSDIAAIVGTVNENAERPK